MLEIPERAYEDCQGQTQKGYSEQLPDDNADFTDRGGAFVAVRPKDNARALQVWVIKYAQKRVEQASTDENFARTNIKDEYIQTVRWYMFPSYTWYWERMVQDKK